MMKWNPTPSQIGGIVRAIAAVGAGIAISYGLGSETIWMEIVGLLGTLGVTIWSGFSNTTKSMTREIADNPDIDRIYARRELANAIPNPKVVSDDSDI